MQKDGMVKSYIKRGLVRPFIVLSAVLLVAAAPSNQALAGSWPGQNGRVAAGQFAVNTYNSDGTGSQPIQGQAWGPDFSSDGTKLAFSNTPSMGDDNDILVATINPDGTLNGTPVNLTAGGGFEDQAPAWSPDGTRIAFISNRGGTPAIYTMNSDGSNIQPLGFNAPLTGLSHPPALHWSPDGTKLIFHDLSADDMFMVNADGSGSITNLSTAFGLTGDERSPVWSPDGTKIAFYSFGGSGAAATNGLYTINLDGSGLTLVQALAGTVPSVGLYWSPDGTQLLYAEQTITLPSSDTVAELYTVSATGGTPQSLNITYDINIAYPGMGYGIAWQPIIPVVPPVTPPAPAPSGGQPTLAATGQGSVLTTVLAGLLILGSLGIVFWHKFTPAFAAIPKRISRK